MFDIKQENIKSSYLIALMFVAYTFSILIRMIWVYQFNGYDEFYWNDQLMINTNDGYIWASSALHELTNQFEHNPRVIDLYNAAIIFVTFMAVKILPFSIESIVLYMPAVISSLVVIPIILIARIYNLTLFGFFSALIGSIAWSYYNRTMIGYYDTDMFSAMAPMFILFFLIKTIEQENLKNALYASLTIFIYPFLYDSGLSIVYAMGIMYMLYMIFFHRNEKFTYQSIILIAIALMGIPFYIKAVLIFGVYFLLQKQDVPLKNLMIISVLTVLIFFISGNVFTLFMAKIASYGTRVGESEGLKFFQVAQTVREAGRIPFETMANRISGSSLGVIVSLIGYILLVIKFRPFILALPLIGIGVFSLWGGLRFTVYAVPIAAMGAVFFFYIIASFFNTNVKKYSVISFLTLAMLYPNIAHIVAYKVPTVFTKTEVKILDELKKISSPKDYTIAWWDYGYPIWYYSNTNTLIDGGKHKHDNFIVSKILNTTSPQLAANLSRVAVETYVSSEYKIVADVLFKNKTSEQLDPALYLDELELEGYPLPPKTRDVFLFLPYKMLGIIPTVNLFSNIDLLTGEKKKKPFFYQSQNFRDEGAIINLGNGVKILKEKGQIELGKQKINIASFIITEYDKNGILKKSIQTNNITAPLSVIYMKNYNKFLILDNQVLNSTYIQMFVLENYDKNLFEAVILKPHAKVYKLKV